MTYKLNLGFYLKKGSLTINNTAELNEYGRSILDMIHNGDDKNFSKCCELLNEHLSAIYLTSNVYELEDIFDSDDDEIEASELKVVKIFKSDGDEICFSAEGSFTIPVSKAINTDEELRTIEEELDGKFDNGVSIQIPIFDENEDDPFAEPNGGDGDMISHWEALGVSVFKN